MPQEAGVDDGASTNIDNNDHNNQEAKPTTPTNCPPPSQNQQEVIAAADNNPQQQDQQLLQALQQQQIQQQHMIALQAMQQQQQQQNPFMMPQNHLLQPAIDPLLQGLVIPNLPQPVMDPSFAAAVASVNNTNNDNSTESIMATEIPTQAAVLNQQQQQQQAALYQQNQMMNPLVLQAMLGQGGVVNQQQMGQQIPTNNEINNDDVAANNNNNISNYMAGINNPMLALTVLANGGQVTPAQIMNGIPVNNFHAAQRTIAQQPYIPMSTTNINAFNNQQLQQMNNSIQQMHTWSDRRQPYQRKKKNKDKDKPKRPLSAYNYFFQEERGRILNKMNKKADEKEDGKEENDEDDDKKVETSAESTKIDLTLCVHAVETSADSTKKDQDKDKDTNAIDSEDNSKKESNTKRTTKTRQKTGIGFESLARQIGAKWKELNDEEVAKYKDLAAADTVRYKKEMEVYKEKVKHAVDGETKVNEMNPFFLRPDVKEAYTNISNDEFIRTTQSHHKYIRPETYTNLPQMLHGQEPMNKRPRKTIAGESIVMDI